MKARLTSLTDVEGLDLEADLITDMVSDPAEVDELRAIYKARRAELVGGDAPAAQQETKPAARTAARRSGMSVE